MIADFRHFVPARRVSRSLVRSFVPAHSLLICTPALVRASSFSKFGGGEVEEIESGQAGKIWVAIKFARIKKVPIWRG